MTPTRYPTVRELTDWLADKPPDAQVYAYEAETTGIVVNYDGPNKSKAVWIFETPDQYGYKPKSE